MTVPDLLPGQPYAFLVSANSATAPFAQSNVVVPLEGTGIRPTDVTVQRGDRTALVSWRRPPTGRGPRIVGYIVTPFIDGIDRGSVRFDSTTTQQRLNGLFPEETYVFTVRAIFSDGTISAADSPSQPVLITARPGEATRLVVKARRETGTATFTWRRPDYTGSSPITSYRVTVFVGDYTVVRELTVGANPTWVTLAGLPSAGSVSFTVAAQNTNGTADPVRSERVTIG